MAGVTHPPATTERPAGRWVRLLAYAPGALVAGAGLYRMGVVTPALFPLQLLVVGNLVCGVLGWWAHDREAGARLGPVMRGWLVAALLQVVMGELGVLVSLQRGPGPEEGQALGLVFLVALLGLPGVLLGCFAAWLVTLAVRALPRPD